MTTTTTRLAMVGMAVLAAASLSFGVSAHRTAETWQTVWTQHMTDDAVEQARRGAEDCTTALWGPTESDAADVAHCVDSAIARAFHVKQSPDA